jgi:hypothetical protein
MEQQKKKVFGAGFDFDMGTIFFVARMRFADNDVFYLMDIQIDVHDFIDAFPFRGYYRQWHAYHLDRYQHYMRQDLTVR